jgi:NAD(P)-dependent dehydrogenase (short-subunit alcohol dehydrogenase family)
VTGAAGLPGRPVGESVVVVTGAASGIGRATVLRLAAEGARVLAADVDEAGLAATREAAGGDGGEVVAVPADVARAADVDALVAAAMDRFGRLDGMVANAGVPSDEPFLSMTEAGMDAVFGVNVKGVVFCGQAAARAMVDQGTGGKIVNLASVAGVVPAPGIAAYSASKAAVQMLTRSMALELGAAGIRVNAVAPGVIRSTMNPLSDPERNRELETGIPLGHIGAPSHVAGVVRFLLSPDADYVSGETVAVDAGWWFSNDPPRRP